MMVKKVVIGLVLLSLCVAIGFTIPFVMSNQKIGEAADVVDLKKGFEQELEAIQEQKLRESYEMMWDEHVDKYPQKLESLLDEMEETNETEVDKASVSDVKSTSDSEVNEDSETQTVALTNTIVEDTSSISDEEVDFFDVETIPLSDGEVVTEKVVKDQWVNQKIQTHKDQISDSDLSAGAGIYNRLDTNYLFGLAEGGLSVEKEAEVKAYLKANLSEAELGKVIELYNKYVHLLN